MLHAIPKERQNAVFASHIASAGEVLEERRGRDRVSDGAPPRSRTGENNKVLAGASLGIAAYVPARAYYFRIETPIQFPNERSIGVGKYDVASLRRHTGESIAKG